MTPHDHVATLLATYGAPDASTAELLCDRHPGAGVAFTVIEPDLSARDVTFGELAESSAKLAAALAARGLGAGDRVATLMGKSAELVVAVLAIWRLGAVHVPLFTAFQPGAIASRITGNNTRFVIADADQRHKLEPSDELPDHPHRTIVTTGVAGGGALGFHDLLAERHGVVPTVAVGGDGTVIELFTSGTTGKPKAVPVPLRAVAGMHVYQQYHLDHTAGDVFWNPSDPGWANGLYYTIIGPMALGHRSLLLHSPFRAELMWAVLSRFQVTNFFAAPTVYRSLRKADVPVPTDLKVRHCSSAGEPLSADVIAWAKDVLGAPIRDQYGQTEMGVITGNPWHPDLIRELRPGSMGRAMPGFTVEVLKSEVDEIAPAGELGRIAIDMADSPLMTFTGYLNAPDRNATRFSADGRWYYTGDVGSRDVDGYFTFGARDDDLILMAGYRIGPFEIESVLDGHEAVAEVAVVAEPDDLRGEIVVAYVVPRPGVVADDDLAETLRLLVKTRLAAHVYPRRVRFVPSLPKTASGKIRRAALKQLPQSGADRAAA
ncbi:MAG TPA: AMP-binding protein [Pseudonocardiaceae bacterium]|nr:AMP-binding protein [Pseudonocardiaceae bacterium]